MSFPAWEAGPTAAVNLCNSNNWSDGVDAKGYCCCFLFCFVSSWPLPSAFCDLRGRNPPFCLKEMQCGCDEIQYIRYMNV